MSYELLTSLYFSEAANADLTSAENRARLHVATPVEKLVVERVADGSDVVLTGNPGDGKSHLVRTLLDKNKLGGAVVELDLSARPTPAVIEEWRSARDAGKPFVLCANEGPLIELLRELVDVAGLSDERRELEGQLGHLLVHRNEDLPPVPRRVLLVDLAERSVLESDLVEAALSRVANEEFMPDIGFRSTETSAGRNLLLLRQSSVCRQRLATVLITAGRHCEDHVTFRQLWAAIAFAITKGKKPAALRLEVDRDEVGLGTFPIDNLVHGAGRSQLLESARTSADPAQVTDPDLDEQIWSTGQPGSGEWLIDDVPHSESPARVWAQGRQDEALRLHAQLKRLVALGHEQGQSLIERLGRVEVLPSEMEDRDLLIRLMDGLRAVYVSPDEQNDLPGWLQAGLPVWINFTYERGPVEERPHVAVSTRPGGEFHVMRPRRAPWLQSALGAIPEEVWFYHHPSRVGLRVDISLLATLTRAARTSGPLEVPEPVQRFMARLSGWEEQQAPLDLGFDRFAILKCPRGRIQVHGTVRSRGAGEAAYGVD